MVILEPVPSQAKPPLTQQSPLPSNNTYLLPSRASPVHLFQHLKWRERATHILRNVCTYPTYVWQPSPKLQARPLQSTRTAQTSIRVAGATDTVHASRTLSSQKKPKRETAPESTQTASATAATRRGRRVLHQEGAKEGGKKKEKKDKKYIFQKRQAHGQIVVSSFRFPRVLITPTLSPFSPSWPISFFICLSVSLSPFSPSRRSAALSPPLSRVHVSRAFRAWPPPTPTPCRPPAAPVVHRDITYCLLRTSHERLSHLTFFARSPQNLLVNLLDLLFLFSRVLFLSDFFWPVLWT